jgi:hypothetical protein
MHEWKNNPKALLRSRSLVTARPELRPWQDGQSIKLGNWAMRDGWESDGIKTRYIYHYDTLMGYFWSELEDKWAFTPVSLGHGSASDAQGMNNLTSIQFSSELGRMLNHYGWVMRMNCKAHTAMWISDSGDVME